MKIDVLRPGMKVRVHFLDNENMAQSGVVIGSYEGFFMMKNAARPIIEIIFYSTVARIEDIAGEDD